jgi:uncharacterized membrane protein
LYGVVLAVLEGMLRPLIVALAVAHAAPVAAQGLTMRERSADVTEATIVVDAPPAQVYEVTTDYRRWPALFSDIRSVKVQGGTRDRARVRFHSHVLDRDVTVQFDNLPGRALRFVAISGAPGGRARGEYVLTPIDGGRRTQVTARLYLKIVGPARLVVSAHDALVMRRAKLRADLTDTQRWGAWHARTASRS